jgi:DNA adenine methylase
MLKRLLTLIPAHQVYCEPFGGAASLLLAKQPSAIEAYNDLNGDLVNLFVIVRDHPLQFLERIYLLPYCRQLFEQWSDEILGGADVMLDPIERAARFYYCVCGSFAGRGPGAGWAFARSHTRHQPLTWWFKATRIPAIHERLRDVYVDCLDFRRFIRNWDSPETFLFVDPPYHETTDYVGVPSFSEKDHHDLAERLTNAKGKWLLTVSDCPLMRELYASFHIQAAETQLAVEKVGKGRARRRLRHLIITNFDPVCVPFKNSRG